MLNWAKRLSEWGALMRERHDHVPWLGMARALLSGPVPADVWRSRIRTCLRCPIYNANNRACFQRLTDGRTVGCGCSVVMKAFTANPYGYGCWGKSHVAYIGWPEYRFPSRLAKVTAFFKFVLNIRSEGN